MRALCGLCVCLSSTAFAFTIETAFSEGCHEKMTLQAYRVALMDWPLSSKAQPMDKTSASLIESLGRRYDLSALNERQRMVFYSLVIGLRSPDTDGHSILELNNTRLVHVPRGKQYRHLLREPDDDGLTGNRRAVEGTRAEVVAKVRQALDALEKPADEQFIEVDTFVEFYGMVPLKVWAPAFYLGEALHRVQDSFSHALRSEDLRRVRHVVNYADGLRGDYDEDRDGLRHSGAMDGCGPTNAPLVDAATQATVEVMRGTLESGDALNQALDNWLTYEAGCTKDNHYCSSTWLAVVRQSQSRALLGCASTDGRWPMGLALVVWLVSRQRKRE